ncbi:hypothetical protein M8C21_020030 [Ambrosia artemisiifolia]|uniref:NB-ARC domain-containing protein n=1 Tax=Ambrosia artemisiifolia TaxID=4212 RepID=A0AAD5D3T8_AMBAR|nr:hypothetical protein M8C21_020030 [Ambrosia artemisiifolia]
MYHYIQFMSSWLTNGSSHTADILTVAGMGGIGKTSLAKYIFQLHSSEFHKSGFIEGINARCNEHYNGLLDIQKQLHGNISKKIHLQVNNVSTYTSMIENALASKMLFIVLDDIQSLDQLDALLGNKGLHPGSKIIITTKDASLIERSALFDPQVQPKHTKMLLNGLCEAESLELLCIHAFKSQKPKEGYKEVLEKLVKYCDGHPLALEVLGKSLRKCEDIDEWEYYIKALKNEPHSRIKKALQMSFDSLQFGPDNKLMMPQLVQEMGRDLVRQESPYKPRKRSRLWCHEESFKVLKHHKLVGSCSKGRRLLGSLKVLDLSFCEKLCSLGGFFELPALERLIVRSCISLIEVCESIEQCVELVYIDLSCCYKLKNPPISIGKLKKVRTLLLDGCNFCESEIEMWDTNSSDTSINSQTSSSTIIDAIPSDLKFFVTFFPTSLIVLSLANNNLSNESFPRDFSSLSMLEELCLDENPIVSMPSCVRSLPRLKILSMKYCEMIISIEHPPHTLKVLTVGHRNSSLQKIKFDAKMSPLNIDGPWKLLSPSSYEIDGMVKIQPLASVEEKVLHNLGWTNLEFIKVKHLETCTFGASDKSQTKMYYEFGIFSTMYHDDKGMPNWIRCRSMGPSISFTIPSYPEKLQGLNFCCMETMGQFSYDTFVLPKIEISNNTRNHTWIYNHYIDKVKVGGKYLTLLSHWMFGPNEMAAGDQITIIVTQRYYNEQLTKICGVNVVYDDGKIEEEEDDVLGYYKSWNHIIGGDLSAFQYTTGEYFLSNMHFFDGSRYKEKEVSFQAFSQKKSRILGHAS